MAGYGQNREAQPSELLLEDARVCDLTMFAWNGETGMVRSIYCEGYSSVQNPPHYMSLEW